ncbi:hypothetical protein ZWY2020_027433 [Hordeum vulgare]|nr:hypothetical protein ZWY2020_027433 [Hordeum vulgare]
MAERKLDRFAALGKDALSLGIDEDRSTAAAMGFVDDPKDQQHLENSIPLSPQWLYAKPSDAKISAPHGSLLEPSEKDVRMLEGSGAKKERRRNAFDAGWLDEERETSLLGRRDHKKEVDREVENRKNDRRSDNVSARDNNDSRPAPTSGRWDDGSTRNSGNEGRRDGKWSLRWGPDDKEKDSKPEKKMDAEKDEPHGEKHTLPVRLLPESDSRDKWRPRHRQEPQTGGTATYRVAPGFGLEKGRVKESNVGFAPGRGRANPNSVPSFSRPSSAGPIGAPPVYGRRAASAGAFRYPRGKLLDIYRQQKVVQSFEDGRRMLEEVPPITLSSSVKPLAFVTPDNNEEAVLEDIRKGRVTSSEATNSTASQKERNKDLEAFGIDANKDKSAEAFSGLSQEGSAALISEKDAFYNDGMLTGGITGPPKKPADENAPSHPHGLSGMRDDTQFNEVKSSADIDPSTKLPDDSNAQFNVNVEYPTGQASYTETKAGGQESYPEELTLYYLDPQGGVQGPFMGTDIVSWYEDGYFGLELPVRLAQAPDDAPFRPLSDLMPYLGHKPQSLPPVSRGGSAESPDSVHNNFEDALPTSGSFGKSDQTTKADSGNYAANPTRGDQEAPLQSHTSWFPSVEAQKTEANPDIRQQRIPETVSHDAEEVLYTGRPTSGMGQSRPDFDNDRADFQLASVDSRSGMREANLPKQDAPRENELSPLGLLWSELEGMHPKQPLSSNVLGVNERRNPKQTAPKDIPPANIRHGPLSRMNEAPAVRDEWSANLGRLDSINDANMSGLISQVEPELGHLNYEEQMLLTQIRREQLQQEQMMGRNNLEFPGQFAGQVFDSLHQHRQSINPPAPEVEHLLRVQFELEHQQRRQQLQQEQHRQQLQQEQHQRQLQQEQHQRQLQQRQAQLLQQQQQQQQQQQLIIEQMLQQQLQSSNFGQANMVDQVLLREQLLNDLHHQPHHFQRQHDAAIEQLIQAKFGHGHHREQHNDMLDVLSRSNQRQALPLEQQILLGLHHDQLKHNNWPMLSRQHAGREEERHLGGGWPMDDPSQFIRTGTSPNQSHTSRLGQFDLLQSLQRSSSVEHHDHLDRSLSMHERLHRGGQGIHSLERSGSLPGGAPLPNRCCKCPNRHHGLGQMETHGDLYSAGQMPMHASGGVHPQQHRLQEQLSGSHMGRLERNWSDANGQLQNSLMEASRINQMQIEAEKQRRNVEMNLPIDNPHAWASLMNNERNPEAELSDMIHQKLVLQAQQSRGFPDVPPTASFGQRSHFSKMGHLGQDGPTSLDILPNNIEMNRKLGPGGKGRVLVQTWQWRTLIFLKRSATGLILASQREAPFLLKRTAHPHTATSQAQAASTDLSSTIRSKKAGHASSASSDEHKMESGVTSAAHGVEAAASANKEAGAFGIPPTSNQDASGPSFSEMLKSTKKPPLQYDASESADGGPGGKGTKKKAKKGKQIDPSLLGFKVHSNRILMGEIHRPDD